MNYSQNKGPGKSQNPEEDKKNQNANRGNNEASQQSSGSEREEE